MKLKTTTKYLKQNYLCMSAGHCDLQYLLHFKQPTMYTCGVYGWNYDVYYIYDIAICTGYRGMPGKKLKHITEYNKKAKAIVENYNLDYNKRKQKVEKILKKFCEINLKERD